MANEQTTYEGLLKDSNFLSSAYHSLRAMGDNTVSEDPKDILDTFLTKRRYFDVNLGSTIVQGNEIKDLPDTHKKLYSHALGKIEALPKLGEGAAPLGDAAIDYGLAAISDPTNLISILAGIFTGGTGGVAIQAGKEALKQGVMSTLKSQIGRKTLAQAGWNISKGLGAEGAVAGIGGATQQKYSQEVDMSLGKRKEGEYDLTAIAKQGLLEGLITPVAGTVINVAGKKVIKPTIKGSLTGAKNLIQKSVEAATKDGSKFRSMVNDQAIQDVTNKLFNNLAPLAARDEISTRLVERSTGEVRPIQEAVEKLSLRMDDRIKANFNDDEGTKLINAAMENQKGALAKVKKIDPEMETIIKDWRGFVEQAQETALGSSYLSKQVRGIYKPKKNTPYVRDIYERFEGVDRPDFDSFMLKPENKNIVDEVFEAVSKDKKGLGIETGLFNKAGKPKFKTEEDKVGMVSKLIKELYLPTTERSARGGALIKKKDIPDVIKRIYGLNFNPAVRALETAKGVIDSSNRIRLGSSLADSLLSRKLAIKADNSVEASRLHAKQTGLPEQDMVPLVTKMQVKSDKEVNVRSPFIFKEKLIDPELTKIFVTRDQASILKELSEGFDGRLPKEMQFNKHLLSDVGDTLAGIQGYLKKGKTVYNPNAHARNALGAVQYTIGSGNFRGLYDGIKLLANPARRKEVSEAVGKLGLKGSQVDINQIMTRIGDLDKVNNKTASNIITNIATGGMPLLEKTRVGRAVSKAAQTAYVATDDLGKIATFLRERKRAESIWNARSTEQKDLLRQKFSKDFNQPMTGKKFNAKDFDNKLLDEAAVQKTTNLLPVYSRIPKVLEKMRQFPVLGSFTAFPAENLRNKYQLFKIAGEEIQEGILTNNKQLIKAGKNRLYSQAIIASAPSVAAHTYNAIEGTSNVTPAIREAGPPWSKNHALAIRKGDNKKDKDKYYYTDLSYNNPDQFAIDFIMPFMVAAANGEDLKENLAKTMVGIATKQAGAFLDPSMAIEAGRLLYDASLSLGTGDDDATANALIKYYKIAEPGLLQMAREAGTNLDIISDDIQRAMNPRYFDEKRKRFSDTGDVSDFLARLGPNFNYNTYDPDTGLPVVLAPWSFASKEREFNPKKNFAFTTRTLLKNSDRDFDSAKENISNMLTDSELAIDYKAIIKEYDNALSEEFAATKQIADLVISYGRFMSPKELSQMLLNDKQAIGSLSKQGVRFLRSNKYKPSSGKKLSQSKDLRARIRKSNRDNVDMQSLMKLFRAVESKYEAKSLSEDVPEEIEFKD